MNRLKYLPLASLLMLASSREAPPPPPPPATLIASDGVKIVYRDAFNQIAPYASGLTIVMISPTDIVDEEDKYQDYNWSAFYNTGCGGESQERQKKAEEILEKAQKRVAQILRERGVVTEAEIAAANKENESAFYDLTHGLALDILSGVFAARNFSAYSKYFEKRALVITEEYYNKNKEGVSLSNLDAAYLKPVPGTARDWIQWTLAHEIEGHVENGHNGNNLTEGVDFCTEIDSAYLRGNALNESESDIDASVIYRHAQSVGAASPADIVKTIWAYRVLSTFYYNDNLYSAKNSTQIADHITTFLFDPDTNDMRARNLSTLPDDIVTVPLAINTVADALAGFLYAQQMRGEYKSYRKYPNDPKLIASHMEELAELGRWVRSHEDGNAYYEFHYAAMVYMRDHGWLGHAKNFFRPESYAAIEDIFTDYFRAVAIAGNKKLADREKAKAMAEAIPSADFDAMFAAIYPPEDKTPESEPTPTS